MLSFLLLSLLGTATEISPTVGEVIFRSEAAFEYAYTDHQGSYAAIPAAVQDFMAEFFRQGHKPASALLGIYLNYAKDSQEADYKWRIALTVAKGTVVKPPLQKELFETQEVIFILRKGSYDTVGETYDLLHKTMAAKGYQINGPAFERYLSDPSQVAPQDLLTEIFIPIKKKD